MKITQGRQSTPSHASNILTSQDNLLFTISSVANVSPAMVLPYPDVNAVLDYLFHIAGARTSRLIVAGHATPELAIAADRAGLELCEVTGVSPFSSDLGSVLKAVSAPNDCIFVSNPNRISGTGWSPLELDQLAQEVAGSFLIVDEYHFDFCGLTAVPLLHTHANIVVLRSPQAISGDTRTDSGYLVAAANIVEFLRCSDYIGVVGEQESRRLLNALTHSGLADQLRELHDDTLQLATELTALGAQCRITPSDYLLVRVASPAEVGNHLTRSGIAVENLDGYVDLKQFIRIRVLPGSIDQLLEAFSRCPEHALRVRSTRGQTMRFTRPAETPSRESEKIATTKHRLERIKIFEANRRLAAQKKVKK